MAQFIALEWDSREARVAVARTRGTGLVIEHAFSVELGPRGTGEAVVDSDVGQRVASALASRRIGRSDTLVAVGRAGIELRLLSLPPAPDDELPEMVRFQSMRQFTGLGDDWPLDFFPVGKENDASQSVLAAAVSPDLVRQIQNNCQRANLRPQRLVLRPCAAASLLLRQREGRADAPVQLMVDLLADEADLTVLDPQSVVFMRTARLPGEWNSPEQSQALLAEIRRTLAAAQNQLSGQLIERIVLCGIGGDQSTLPAQIEEKLKLPVEHFNPFDGLSLSDDLRSHLPEHAGRFAPLLGMLLDESTGAKHAIDFLHPRKKPEPASRRPWYVFGSAAAAILALAVGGGTWYGLDALNSDVKSLQATLDDLNKATETAEQHQAQVRTIDTWLAKDVNWLDELRRLSEKLPPAEKSRVSRLLASAKPDGGGQLTFDGFVDDGGTIGELELSLSSDQHHVFGDGGQLDNTDPKYAWKFDEIVLIDIAAEEPSRDDEPAQQADTEGGSPAATTQ
jgi:Tfp pilus assembly PilM family ATPase